MTDAIHRTINLCFQCSCFSVLETEVVFFCLRISSYRETMSGNAILLFSITCSLLSNVGLLSLRFVLSSRQVEQQKKYQWIKNNKMFLSIDILFLFIDVFLMGDSYPPKLSKRIMSSSTPSEWRRSSTVFAIIGGPQR